MFKWKELFSTKERIQKTFIWWKTYSAKYYIKKCIKKLEDCVEIFQIKQIFYKICVSLLIIFQVRRKIPAKSASSLVPNYRRRGPLLNPEKQERRLSAPYVRSKGFARIFENFVLHQTDSNAREDRWAAVWRGPRCSINIQPLFHTLPSYIECRSRREWIQKRFFFRVKLTIL